jgi:hypothetical protein
MVFLNLRINGWAQYHTTLFHVHQRHTINPLDRRIAIAIAQLTIIKGYQKQKLVKNHKSINPSVLHCAFKAPIPIDPSNQAPLQTVGGARSSSQSHPDPEQHYCAASVIFLHPSGIAVAF